MCAGLSKGVLKCWAAWWLHAREEPGSGNHCLPFLTGSGDLFFIILIFYHRFFVVLQTDFLPLFLNSWRGAFKDALPICCSCCGQLPQGQPGAAPSCVPAKHLAELGSEKPCGPHGYQVALASSWIFQYNSQWLGNLIPAGLLAAHHAECMQSYDAFY